MRSMCSGCVTSSSSTSGVGSSFRAVRSVSRKPRPAPVRISSAPSAVASWATEKASEASVSTPVISNRFRDKRPIGVKLP